MIYAVDFDGTLCTENWPEIGEPNTALIRRLIALKAQGNELILWTMREGKTLEQAVAWCKRHGLTFDAVNDNIERLKEQYGNNPRKVFADVYIDDHNERKGTMLECEGYRMFKGEATITPPNPKFQAETIYGTWLYKPEWDCWYVNGSSYPAEVVSGFTEDSDERNQV